MSSNMFIFSQISTKILVLLERKLKWPNNIKYMGNLFFRAATYQQNNPSIIIFFFLFYIDLLKMATNLPKRQQSYY